MNIVEIPVKKITLTYPSEWEELTRRQSIRIGQMLYLLNKGLIDPDQFRKLAVDMFINRVNNPAMKLTNDQELDLWGNEWILAETMNFFFEIKKDEKTGKESFELLPRFVKNLVPWFSSGLKKYYGPGDFMAGMVFSEFKDVLAAAGKFMETGEDIWLDRVLAILYRRRVKWLWRKRRSSSWNGQERIAYNAATVDRRMKLFARVNEGVKFMSFLYIMGCLYMLRTDADNQGIEIDGSKCYFSMLFKNRKGEGRGKGDKDGIGMMGVMMAMAESGVFGNIHETAKSDVWDVLVRMYQLELDRREFERASERAK
jgi:hypothetical protein